MKILLTGANGYIGKRLLPVLLEQGHELICCVRDKKRFDISIYIQKFEVVEIDFLKPFSYNILPTDIDIAYFLIHSMSTVSGDFEEMEIAVTKNFIKYLHFTSVKQIIYLSGITNEKTLSKHLQSRLNVENIFFNSEIPVTVLKAGIIVGSGSASFEIIRDLVEKLPVMITPKWLYTKCQPIAIRNVIHLLVGVIGRRDCYNQSFDIGGPDVLTYKQMLQQYAEVRKQKRYFIVLPIMSPRMSSVWLYFITSTTYRLALNLVDSMKVDVICQDNRLMQMLTIEPIRYKRAIEMAFDKIKQNLVVSSWKDSLISSSELSTISNFIEVPDYGCYKDVTRTVIKTDVNQVIENLWSIGGERGWYYASWLWQLRGWFDRLVKGVGLRRGRTNPNTISAGDALDFWRVLFADKVKTRLLLYAEMKLPGEAWLEFRIKCEKGQMVLYQTATFRPNGIWGRIYWYLMLPFHFFLFSGMSRKMINYLPKNNDVKS